MTLENGGAGVVPVMDMNRGYGDCMGFGGGWWAWILIIFVMMGGWGGNWNNRGNMGAEIFANGSMTRDKLADRDRDLQTANFHLSQQAQNATLIGTLRPYPQPAYLTNSPYQSIAANVAGACGCAYQQQLA